MKFIFAVLIFLFSISSHAHDEFIGVIYHAKQFVVVIDVDRSKNKRKKKSTQTAVEKADDFFSDDFEVPRRGRGSGFVVGDVDLRLAPVSVLTAAHVVKGASRIRVTLASGKRYRAEVLWVDSRTDLAMLAVDTKGREKTVTDNGLMLSRGEVQEGQSVLAMARSFNLSLVSSSKGIVSATNVELVGRKGRLLTQTDAVINPGSSGGALLDAQGEVVGLISNIYGESGTFSGVSFVVPSGSVREVALKKAKKVKRRAS